MAQGVGLYAGPLAITIESLIAEGDRAAVQLVIDGRTAKGEPYHNSYHFAFRVRDGRICEVREYVDTLYAQQKLFA
jgi:ketosteroid isomerase-like protein